MLIQPVKIASLPRMDLSSYDYLIERLEEISKSKITRKTLDQLRDLKNEHTGDVDLYEILEIPRLTYRKDIGTNEYYNFYRPAMGLIHQNQEGYLSLTKLGSLILEKKTQEERIICLFLIVNHYYPHIRALFYNILFSDFYVETIKEKWPNETDPEKLKYYILQGDERDLNKKYLFDIVQSSCRDAEFLKYFYRSILHCNRSIFLIDINLGFLDEIDKKIKIQDYNNEDLTFNLSFKMNKFSIKSYLKLTGVRDDKIRSILYNVYSKNYLKKCNLNQNVLNYEIGGKSFKDIYPGISKIYSQFELITEYLKRNYKEGEYINLENFFADLLEQGNFSLESIKNWQFEIEKHQKGDKIFSHPQIEIETKSGSFGALGFFNQAKYANFKYKLIGG